MRSSLDKPPVTKPSSHLCIRGTHKQAESEPEHLLSDLFGGPRGGPLGLLRDLHDLYLASTESDICWTLITQGARGARDIELLDIAIQMRP